MSESTEIVKDKLSIQLGDIVEIIAPTDPALNNHTFYIKFLDKSKIVLLESNGLEQTLTLDETGKLDNEAITGINILSRAESSSYAIQNDLIPGKWIDIYFGGDVPTIITGEITNLEEDMIEITTYPEKDVIFIDFAYKGIPEDIPIIKINLRKKPAGASEAIAVAGPGAVLTEQIAETSIIEEIERKSEPITSLEGEEEVEIIEPGKIEAQIREMFISADQIQFGSDLAEITQVVELPESEQRYSLEKQTTDLLDELLSTIPNIKRTDAVLNNIHLMIERFKQLRKKFSVFDKDGNLVKPKINGSDYKPLVDTLYKFNQKLYWILPVVKNMKKIYDYDESSGGDYTDVIPLTLAQSRNSEEDIIEQYKAGNVPEQDNKYAYLIKGLNPYLTPFASEAGTSASEAGTSEAGTSEAGTSEAGTSEAGAEASEAGAGASEVGTSANEGTEDLPTLARIKVNANISAIVDNLGDFYSSVMSNNKDMTSINRRRFVMQEYNLGMTGLDVTKFRGGDTIVNRKQITPNDTMDISSLLLLPEVTVRFSRINLPYTNILMKANLNEHFLNYWQFLKTNTDVKTTVLENLSEPVDYDRAGFLKRVEEIKLGESKSKANTKDMYINYLNAIIPRTRFLFNLIKPYINDNLTLHDVLSYLEPFMIYQDDLSLSQYQDMSDYISQQIADRKKKYLLKVRDYNSLKTAVNTFKPKLIALFDTNNALKEAVLVGYGLNEASLTNMSSEEIIVKINSVDCGRLYNTSIALIGSDLMIKGSAPLEPQIKGQAQQTELQHCNSYTAISKRYIALDELQQDNNVDVYFDKKYDTTYYELMAEYKKPDPGMSDEAYIGFLINNLMKKNGLSESIATREARALLEGKRLVEEGDYAILEDENAMEGQNTLSIHYYRRENNAWVRDESISSDVFDDKLKMICNLDEKCLEVKGKCDTMEQGSNEIKEANLKLVLKEFDEHLTVNKAVIVKHINEDLTDAMKRIGILLDLIHTQTYKNNYKQYNLGISLEEVDIIRSPYIKLRDVILGQADYVKRQQDIIKFVNAFTREPMPLENTYWLYCTKTNTPLLPTFISQLARAFVSQENYLGMIEQICKNQGKLSDDGDSWVDKHSGYIIRKISLNVEEEYTEEGYKNITRAVLEADVGQSIIQMNKAQKQFVDPETEKIANIIKSISYFMSINMDPYKEFIIRNVRLLQESKMIKEVAYNKMLEKASTQGKKNLDDFQTAYYQFLIFSTLAYFFIAIQASIPSIRTRKTHPGCVRSFTGFPMGGAEDMTGLTYLACIVHKIKSPIDHWKSIQKMNIAMITKRIETQITKFILLTEEVQALIKAKENYLLLNIEDTIPDELNIANMTHFLPPLVSIKMPTIQNVTDAFNKELLDALRKGSVKQEQMINIIRSKIIQFSFGIIELIQKTVHKKAAIMTNNIGEPFLENACCDSTGDTGTLKYFIREQPDIGVYNDRVIGLANTLHDILRMGKAGIYYDPRDTKNIIPPLPGEFSEETIYKAFIVFCKYGTTMPISEELRAICMNKPEGFNDKAGLSEQIRRLKSDGRNYSQETFQQLLTLVNRNNIVNSERQTLTMNTVEALKDILERENVLNMPLAFTEKFKRILDNFEINGLVEDTAEMRLFQNYLSSANDLMVASINDFVQRSPVIKKDEFKFFKECIDSISDFQETGDNMVIESQDETVFKMMTFIKNSLRCLTREFPNIIINKVDNANVVIPKHWGLSDKHTGDIRSIINNHYVSLYEFYDIEDVEVILQQFIRATRDTDILAKLTEFYAPLSITRPQAQSEQKYIYSTMERRLTIRLFKYYFYSTLTTLISLKDDDEVLIKRKVKKVAEEDLGESELTTTEHAFDAQNGDITELEIVSGEKKDIADNIAKLLNAFVSIICNDKKVINYNYKGMMDKVLRSKEKEKDDITFKLKEMTDEEREVETIFKNQKLERWNKGLQKGLVSYQKDTYDEEREAMEKQMKMDSRLGKNKDISDMNKEMYAFDMVEEDQTNAEIDDEVNRIDYMGEDADYEELGLDGDEEFL